ncbi:MAG: hypothetical protein COA79_20770 [Planctomycetota bacterium]|nr:MAG: hypothetical protein COA79_20770 [Planctomycetota bacterium]
MNDLIKEYLTSRPQAVIEESPYIVQGTNSAVYKGLWMHKPAMFKFSIRNSAQREADALNDYFNIGCVPELYDVYKDLVLVTEFIDGESLLPENINHDNSEKLCSKFILFINYSLRDVGSNFNYISSFRRSLEELLESNPNHFQENHFKQSIELIFKNWEFISQQSGALYYDDIGGSNVIYTGDKIQFIDFESVWPGNSTLQIGTIIANYTQHNLNPVNKMLITLCRSACSFVPTNFEAWLSAAYLKWWVRICYFHRWNYWETRKNLRYESEEELKRIEHFGRKIKSIKSFADNFTLDIDHS